MLLKESQLIEQLASGFRRSPIQVNPLFGSDSELVRLRECGNTLIALTTDGIIEEILQGLYTDPFLVGWMTVMVNLSDLAAVGARPVGVLIQLNLPADSEDSLLDGLRQGIEAACQECGTYVLGGDINFAAQLSTGGTAFGIVPGKRSISRQGSTIGDLLYTTAPAGLGSAFAFAKIFSGEHIDIQYKPVARLKQAAVVREFATACLDTSDGLIPGLAQLGYINEVGFDVTTSYEELLHPAAKKLATQAGFPDWFLMAGPHGDFELLFTLAPKSEEEFVDSAGDIGWKPVFLGKVIPEGLALNPGTGTATRTDAALIANLFGEANADPQTYIESLKAFHEALVNKP